MMNPITPHFAQYCWETYVYPAIARSKNYPRKAVSNLNHMVWPTPSGPFDKTIADRLSLLKDTKSAIRLGFDKAKSGGKKKGKKPVEGEAKQLEKCIIFVAKEYPAFQKQCLEILS
jgi:hypothetical protein